jgi:hypothetical protein
VYTARHDQHENKAMTSGGFDLDVFVWQRLIAVTICTLKPEEHGLSMQIRPHKPNAQACANLPAERCSYCEAMCFNLDSKIFGKFFISFNCRN